MISERTFMPAAGRDLFLPLYDPFTKLLGLARIHGMLIEHAGIKPAFKVLDVGCGTGTLAVAIKQQFPTVDVVALEYSDATARAPFSVYRSAVPWYWIVWSVMPAPGDADVSTFR